MVGARGRTFRKLHALIVLAQEFLDALVGKLQDVLRAQSPHLVFGQEELGERIVAHLLAKRLAAKRARRDLLLRSFSVLRRDIEAIFQRHRASHDEVPPY